MVGTVVAAASITAIAIGTVAPTVSTIIVDAIVPHVTAHLMLALLVVGRIIGAATCLSDGRYRKGTGGGERSDGFRVPGVHVGVPPHGIVV